LVWLAHAARISEEDDCPAVRISQKGLAHGRFCPVKSSGATAATDNDAWDAIRECLGLTSIDTILAVPSREVSMTRIQHVMAALVEVPDKLLMLEKTVDT